MMQQGGRPAADTSVHGGANGEFGFGGRTMALMAKAGAGRPGGRGSGFAQSRHAPPPSLKKWDGTTPQQTSIGMPPPAPTTTEYRGAGAPAGGYETQRPPPLPRAPASRGPPGGARTTQSTQNYTAPEPSYEQQAAVEVPWTTWDQQQAIAETPQVPSPSHIAPQISITGPKGTTVQADTMDILDKLLKRIAALEEKLDSEVARVKDDCTQYYAQVNPDAKRALMFDMLPQDGYNPVLDANRATGQISAGRWTRVTAPIKFVRRGAVPGQPPQTKDIVDGWIRAYGLKKDTGKIREGWVRITAEDMFTSTFLHYKWYPTSK